MDQSTSSPTADTTATRFVATPVPQRTPAAPTPVRGQRFQRALLPEPVSPVEPGVRPALRDRAFRCALVAADALAALAALVIAVVVLGEGDPLRPGALLVVPLMVAASKLVGLYDRDEMLLHKTTLDEAPRLFQLATFFTLLAWLLESVLISGKLAAPQVVGLWGTLFAFALAGRLLARRQARR